MLRTGRVIVDKTVETILIDTVERIPRDVADRRKIWTKATEGEESRIAEEAIGWTTRDEEIATLENSIHATRVSTHAIVNIPSAGGTNAVRDDTTIMILETLEILETLHPEGTTTKILMREGKFASGHQACRVDFSSEKNLEFFLLRLFRKNVTLRYVFSYQ